MNRTSLPAEWECKTQSGQNIRGEMAGRVALPKWTLPCIRDGPNARGRVARAGDGDGELGTRVGGRKRAEAKAESESESGALPFLPAHHQPPFTPGIAPPFQQKPLVCRGGKNAVPGLELRGKPRRFQPPISFY